MTKSVSALRPIDEAYRRALRYKRERDFLLAAMQQILNMAEADPSEYVRHVDDIANVTLAKVETGEL